MEIPANMTREERKVWWAKNGEAVKAESAKKNADKIALAKSITSTPTAQDVRIVYIKLNGKPVGCLATRLNTNNNTKVMFFQFSARNPLDRYSRSEAKRIALERLESNPSSVVGTSESTPYMLKYTATQLIAGASKDEIKFPQIIGYKLQDYPRVKKNGEVRAAMIEWLEFRNATDNIEQTFERVNKFAEKTYRLIGEGIPFN